MKRILLVEDDEVILTLMSRALEEDYDITAARSAEEATGYAAERETLDLLITDLVLPGSGGGLQVAWQFLERSPELPVLVISGYVLAEDRIEHALSSPRTAFLQKPFAISELRKTVRALLD